MNTIALSNVIALLARWSATGCDAARNIKGPTPMSPPRSWLPRIAVGAAASSNALIKSRDPQRPGPDPITAARAAAAKSP
jgi:hypothetical protein